MRTGTVVDLSSPKKDPRHYTMVVQEQPGVRWQIEVIARPPVSIDFGDVIAWHDGQTYWQPAPKDNAALTNKWRVIRCIAGPERAKA